MSQSRQLAAIMFTDIVGYTALMDEDEQRAFELLKKNRQVQRPLIEKYNGRWLKEMGDGVLASFATVTDAVYCAAAIQKTCEDEPDLNLRIGIHQGEVVFDGEDVFGSGVNIASRIEPLSPVGGILVTEAVHNNLLNKNDVESIYIGEKQLKNVKKPVKVYQVHVEGVELIVKPDTSATPQQIPPKSSNSRKMAFAVAGVIIVLILSYLFNSNFNTGTTSVEPQAASLDKSIVVLPFTNMSNDPDQDYFSDGMMEEILNHLVKIEDLKVISRTTAMQYKGTTKSVHDITEELHVATALEGSVRKDGDQVRITVQLIEGNTDMHLWSESYDRQLTNIFEVQSDVAKQIAHVLLAEISPDITKKIEAQPTTNTEAYNLFLLAEQVRQIDTSQAIELYEEVIQMDPEFARAYVEIGALKRGIENPDAVKAVEIAKPYYEKALEIDPENYWAHLVKGQSHLWYEWDFEKADQEYQFLKLHYPYSFILPALLLSSGRFKEVLENSKRNLKTDPLNPIAIAYYLHSLYYNGQEEQVLEEIPKALLVGEGSQHLGLFLFNRIAEVYQFMGMHQESLWICENHLSDDNGFRRQAIRAINYFHLQQPDKTMKILQEMKLQAAASGQNNTSIYIALVYAQMKENDLAFEWLETAYLNQEKHMYWLKVYPTFKPLHGDPRWQEILDKVGFPE